MTYFILHRLLKEEISIRIAMGPFNEEESLLEHPKELLSTISFKLAHKIFVKQLSTLYHVLKEYLL
jgi:hypothetical protein